MDVFSIKQHDIQFIKITLHLRCKLDHKTCGLKKSQIGSIDGSRGQSNFLEENKILNFEYFALLIHIFWEKTKNSNFDYFVLLKHLRRDVLTAQNIRNSIFLFSSKKFDYPLDPSLGRTPLLPKRRVFNKSSLQREYSSCYFSNHASSDQSELERSTFLVKLLYALPQVNFIANLDLEILHLLRCIDLKIE